MQRSQAVSGEGRYLYLYDAARDIAPDDYNEVRHARRDDGALPGRRARPQPRGARRRRPRRRVDDRAPLPPRRLGGAGGRGGRAREGGQHRADGRRPRRAAAGDRRPAPRRADARVGHVPRGDAAPGRRGSSSPGRSRRASRTASAPRATTPARRSGRSPCCTKPSPARAGTSTRAPPRSSSPPAATRWRACASAPSPTHWAAYGLAEMAEWGLSEPEIEYARRLAGRFGLLIRVETQRRHGLFGGPGRLFRDEVPASAFGTWDRGHVGALAPLDGRRADGGPAPRDRGAAGARRRPAGRGGRSTRARRRSTRTPIACSAPGLSAGLTRMDDQSSTRSPGCSTPRTRSRAAPTARPDVLLTGPPR